MLMDMSGAMLLNTEPGFVMNILGKIEIRAPLWIQISKDLATEMQKDGVPTMNYFGYQYNEEDSMVDMCEKHVDDHETFPETVYLTEFGNQFGGLLSKRRKESSNYYWTR